MRFSALGAEDEEEHRRRVLCTCDRGLGRTRNFFLNKFQAIQELKDDAFRLCVVVDNARQRKSTFQFASHPHDYWIDFVAYIQHLIGEEILSMHYKDPNCGCLRSLFSGTKESELEIYEAFYLAKENGHKLQVFVDTRRRDDSAVDKDDTVSSGDPSVDRARDQNDVNGDTKAAVDGAKDGFFCAKKDGTTYWCPKPDSKCRATKGCFGVNQSLDSRANINWEPYKEERNDRPENGRRYTFSSDSSDSIGIENSDVDTNDYSEDDPCEYDSTYPVYTAKRNEKTADEMTDFKSQLEKLTLLGKKVDQGIETLICVSQANCNEIGAMQRMLRQELLRDRMTNTSHNADIKQEENATCNDFSSSTFSQLGKTESEEDRKSGTEKLVNVVKTDVLPTGGTHCDEASGETVHWGVLCNNCRCQIVGVRYLCGNCVDFDLCSKCEGTPDSHYPDHIFLKIRTPLPTCAIIKTAGVLLPLFKHSLYEEDDTHRMAAASTSAGHSTNYSENSDASANIKENSIEPLKPIKSFMDAEFVDDETVPDGTRFHPGQSFTKSWRVVNSGSRPWSKDTLLKFLWGTKGFVPNIVEVVVPPLGLNRRGTISVGYVSPMKPGFYESHWNFVHKGHLFGHRIWCSIEVIDPDVATKAPELHELRKSSALNIQELNDEVTSEAVECSQSSQGKGCRTKMNLIQDDCHLDDQKTVFCSQTTTPNNTPFVLSPPKSPELLDLGKNMRRLESLHDGISVLGTADSEFTGVSSACSSDSSDSEYIFVPMPHCFAFSASRTPTILEGADAQLNSGSQMEVDSGSPILVIDPIPVAEEQTDPKIQVKTAVSSSSSSTSSSHSTSYAYSSSCASVSFVQSTTLPSETRLDPEVNNSAAGLPHDPPTEMLGIQTQPTRLLKTKLVSLLGEMGFDNAAYNNRLAAKHDCNIEKVLEDLLKRDDNWYDRRH